MRNMQDHYAKKFRGTEGEEEEEEEEEEVQEVKKTKETKEKRMKKEKLPSEPREKDVQKAMAALCSQAEELAGFSGRTADPNQKVVRTRGTYSSNDSCLLTTFCTHSTRPGANRMLILRAQPKFEPFCVARVRPWSEPNLPLSESDHSSSSPAPEKRLALLSCLVGRRLDDRRRAGTERLPYFRRARGSIWPSKPSKPWLVM